MQKYTDEQYIDMVNQANESGKMLYIINGELEINDINYYICNEGTNETDGTLTPNYGELKKESEKKQIQEQLVALDQKRIRAICEPELKNAEEGETWLEYYNSQIFELREKLAQL